MKTTIEITGQINGNSTLKKALRFRGENGLIESTYLPYGGHRFTYATRKEARKALWETYKDLMAAEPEFKHGISYCPKHSLSYDASRAVIIYEN